MHFVKCALIKSTNIIGTSECKKLNMKSRSQRHHSARKFVTLAEASIVCCWHSDSDYVPVYCVVLSCSISQSISNKQKQLLSNNECTKFGGRGGGVFMTPIRARRLCENGRREEPKLFAFLCETRSLLFPAVRVDRTSFYSVFVGRRVSAQNKYEHSRRPSSPGQKRRDFKQRRHRS